MLVIHADDSIEASHFFDNQGELELCKLCMSNYLSFLQINISFPADYYQFE